MRKENFSLHEFYHCYNRGTEKRKIFISDRDYLRFAVLLFVCNSETPIHISNFETKQLIELFEVKRGKALVAIGAWSLMPNHFHILLREIRQGGISQFMQKLQTAYTMYFNKKYQRSGGLFQGTFRAEHLDKDIYLKYIFSYIHLNPIKIIEPKWREKSFQENKEKKRKKIFLENYRWSSYFDYRRRQRPENRILDIEIFPTYFQNLQDFDSEIEGWLDFDHNKHLYGKA